MPCCRSPRVRTQMCQNWEPKVFLILLQVAQFRRRPWRERQGFSVFRQPQQDAPGYSLGYSRLHLVVCGEEA